MIIFSHRSISTIETVHHSQMVSYFYQSHRRCISNLYYPAANNFNQTSMQAEALSAEGSISNIHVCPPWYGSVTDPPIQVKIDPIYLTLTS